MILAINTGSENNSIALYEKNKIEKEVSWQSYRTQSKELLPKINQLLQDNKFTPKSLDAIAVFAGPGSFTGLRVGVSVANALAWSLDIPVIGIKVKNKKSKVKSKSYKLKIDQDDCKVNNLSALDIAKRGCKVLVTKKLKKFSKIVEPFYNFPLK